MVVAAVVVVVAVTVVVVTGVGVQDASSMAVITSRNYVLAIVLFAPIF